MKKILVPTDFSETAKCAFIYAQKLSEAVPDSSIHVIHLYLPAMEAEYPNVVPPVPEYIKAREDMLTRFVEEGLDECKADMKEVAPVTQDLLIGFPADEIGKISEDYDLIVMGTTGETDLLDRLFGSVSSNVAKRAQCPTLLVPKGVSFHPIKQLLYTANYESADDDAIEQLLKINQYFKAKVHFLHVQDEDDEQAYAKNKEEIFAGLFEDGIPEFSFTMEEVPGKDVPETISNYAVEHGIDLVVMATPQRSFWERFVHRSKSRKMALTTKIPLMIYHIND